MINKGRVSKADKPQSSAPGVVLLPPVSVHPLAYNREALEILAFPTRPEELAHPTVDLAREIGATLLSRLSNGARKFVAEFQSGTRTYRCRALSVCFDGKDAADPGGLTTLILLERQASPSRMLKRQAWEKFGLTLRERQMVELLIQGMTTKEMAQALRLSPNTIKSFLRLIMAKMGVSTRSGVVGKVLERNRPPSNPATSGPRV
jgi:DNA-binding CsgD family transcriptional regulator